MKVHLIVFKPSVVPEESPQRLARYAIGGWKQLLYRFGGVCLYFGTSKKHVKKISIVCCFLLLAGLCSGQSLEKRALKNIHHEKWQKAFELLSKADAKGDLPILTQYAWTRYFFTANNPAYNIDSAYTYVTYCLEGFSNATSKQKEKLLRLSVDSLGVVKLRENIDSVAFSITRKTNTEESYVKFLQQHTHSRDRQTAEQLRNAVAFLEATRENTFSAFKTFLDKYPGASEAADAKARYERLLFEERTKDQRLTSFENFLKEYPESSFRKEIERQIFELSTLSGEVDKFVSFLNTYPKSVYRNKAINILFHVLYDGEELMMPAQFLNDSLRKVVSLNEGYLTPFLKKDKFGFMNGAGYEVIPPSFIEIPSDYTCGNIAEDVLVVSEKIIARNGAVIFNGQVKDLDDIGTGFLKISTGSCVKVVHKSGFLIDSCIVDAKILNKRYLAIQNHSGWVVKSLSGRSISPGPWDEINLAGDIIACKRGNKYFLFPMNTLVEVPNEQLSVPFIVDSYKLLADHSLWIKSEGEEGVYDRNLQEIIAKGEYSVLPYFDGFIVRSPDGFSIHDRTGKISSYFDQVYVQNPRIAVKKDGRYFLFDEVNQSLSDTAYDTLQFDGPFLTAYKADSIDLYCISKVIHFSEKANSKYILGRDSISYMLIDVDGKKYLIDQDGNVMFSGSSNAFENLQHAGGNYFIVTKKEKKGLIDSKGKGILPIEYDAIGTATNGTISLLRGMKFGLLNLTTRKLIKPEYDKNLIPYGSSAIFAYKDGRQGLIDWNNRPQSKFEFEEVKYWNDSTALVKRQNLWELFELTTKRTVLSDIKELIPVHETADEKVFIMNQNNLFGAYSSQKGKIIPFSFTDLVNVGSPEEPLYFTEKHVEEASVFVVIYYDKNGKMLRREVYEEADDYDRIYCRQN